jgi:recombinase
VWLQAGRHNLVRELHAEGCNVEEIQQRMAVGQNSTGQRRTYNILSIYLILKKLGLKPHRRPQWYNLLQDEAARLFEQGYSMRQIADQFNKRGLTSQWGKPWTKKLIYALLAGVKKGPYALDRVQFEAIADARGRGLKYAQMAVEFNERKVPRRDNRPWTARAISERWHDFAKRFRSTEEVTT